MVFIIQQAYQILKKEVDLYAMMRKQALRKSGLEGGDDEEDDI